MAVKNRARYQLAKRESEEAWANYKKREVKVRDHYVKFPEHERDFLPYLKSKLESREEQQLYEYIKAAYKEIRLELLGLISSLRKMKKRRKKER